MIHLIKIIVKLIEIIIKDKKQNLTNMFNNKNYYNKLSK